MSEFLIDGRFLDPPEPFVRVMESLDGLDSGQYEAVILSLYREPFPLYKSLADNGYAVDTRQAPDGSFVIRITPVPGQVRSAAGPRPGAPCGPKSADPTESA